MGLRWALVAVACIVALVAIVVLVPHEGDDRADAQRAAKRYTSTIESSYVELRRLMMFPVSQRLGPDGEKAALVELRRELRRVDTADSDLAAAHRHLVRSVDLRIDSLDASDDDDPDLVPGLYQRSRDELDAWADGVRDRSAALDIDIDERAYY